MNGIALGCTVLVLLCFVQVMADIIYSKIIPDREEESSGCERFVFSAKISVG